MKISKTKAKNPSEAHASPLYYSLDTCNPEFPAQITLRLIPEPEQVSSLDPSSAGQIMPLVCAPLGLGVGKNQTFAGGMDGI